MYTELVYKVGVYAYSGNICSTVVTTNMNICDFSRNNTDGRTVHRLLTFIIGTSLM